jgi:hypothetical protein
LSEKVGGKFFKGDGRRRRQGTVVFDIFVSISTARLQTDSTILGHNFVLKFSYFSSSVGFSFNVTTVEQEYFFRCAQ